MGKTGAGSNFVQMMDQQLRHYQVQKAERQQQRQEYHQPRRVRELAAREALIDAGEDHDTSRVPEDDLYIGRWASYKVPPRIEDRLSINHTARKELTRQHSTFKLPPTARERPTRCQSERSIKKCRISLQQLQAPSHNPPGYAGPQPPRPSGISVEALAISNKQEIRPTGKLEKKLSGGSNSGENRRPPSGITSRGTSGEYGKIKRTFGFANHLHEGEILYEKEVLTTLVRSGQRQEPSGLQSMLNTYFTIATGETKRPVAPSRLGLDRLLS